MYPKNELRREHFSLESQSSMSSYDDDLMSSSEASSVNLNGQGNLAATTCNFTWMAILFSSNHGCVVACLALATAQLGSVGAWQSGILYFTYTLSAMLGATYVVKQMGPRNALVTGMGLYVAYVGCFALALSDQTSPGSSQQIAYTGAAIGGWGAGLLWTAQGAYFAQAAEEHSHYYGLEASIGNPAESGSTSYDISKSTSTLAGIFAFWYLAEEVALRMLSSVLLEFEWASWEGIFWLYTSITVFSTIAMIGVHDYSKEKRAYSTKKQHGVWYKATAAMQLMWSDPKMKYMIGVNAAYGLASAFCNSYVNGEVVPVALNDKDSQSLGVLTSLSAGVAAFLSLALDRISSVIGKASVLNLGSLCFLFVAMAFALTPQSTDWTWRGLLLIYTLMGMGRATFEGTWKATFADMFAYEKEGAFANIIVQNGLSSSLGFVLAFHLPCPNIHSRYCIEYRDGSHQFLLWFEMLIVLASILGILGYHRASKLHRLQQKDAMWKDPTRGATHETHENAPLVAHN